MPREIPDCPHKPNPASAPARSYEIELITPVFGGGKPVALQYGKFVPVIVWLKTQPLAGVRLRQGENSLP